MAWCVNKRVQKGFYSGNNQTRVLTKRTPELSQNTDKLYESWVFIVAPVLIERLFTPLEVQANCAPFSGQGHFVREILT